MDHGDEHVDAAGKPRAMPPCVTCGQPEHDRGVGHVYIPTITLAPNDDAALLASFPPGVLAAVADVLRAGGITKGCATHESGGGQSFGDHVGHAYGHAHSLLINSDEDGLGDASEEDITHAIARLMLAWSTRDQQTAEGGEK